MPCCQHLCPRVGFICLLPLWEALQVHQLSLTLLLLFNHQVCVWFCDPVDWSTSGFSILYYLLNLSVLIFMFIELVTLSNKSYPLPPASLLAFILSEHQGLFQWVGSLHQVAKVLELQQRSFQWIFRVDLFYLMLLIILKKKAFEKTKPLFKKT